MPLGPVGRGWYTVLDFDFSAQVNQTLGADGYFTIGGLQWNKSNTAHEAAAMAIVNGSGLVIQPAAASDYSTSTFTAPRLWLPFSQISQLSTIEWSTSMRIWAHISADNGAANFDNAIAGVDTNDLTYGYITKRGHGTVNVGMQHLQVINNGGGNGFVAGNVLVLGAANNVMVIEIPQLLGFVTKTYIAPFGTTWPSPDQLQAYNMGQQGAQAIATFSAPNPPNPRTNTPQTMGVCCAAQRAGSGTAYSTTIAHLRVDIRS